MSTSDDRDLVADQLATEEGVYGVLLVSGMIVASGSTDFHAWQVFATVVTTVIVFWAAHVYAGTVAHHRVVDNRIVTLPEAFRYALHRSRGMLVAALIPSAILLLGATEVVRDDIAIWLALWTGVAVLAVLGFVAFRRRGSRLVLCLLGSAATAGFGIVMILLKAALH